MRKIIVILCLLLATQVDAQIRLWKGTSERAHARLTVLTPYIPEHNPTGMAVIVCPGGSYFWLAKQDEGTLVGEWLRSQGIAAFVLEYRSRGILPYAALMRRLMQRRTHPVMLRDAQRAIQYVRQHAAEYGINPDMLGIMGFSAGGHLAMLTAETSTVSMLPAGIADITSLRPDFVASIYPVVTLNGPYAHQRSRRGLLGESRMNKQLMRDSLSTELHVPDDCPPVFLINCTDDPVVDYHNAMLLDSALTSRHIPHLYIRYRTGGHGFGADLRKGTDESRQWMDEFIRWSESLTTKTNRSNDRHEE